MQNSGLGSVPSSYLGGIGLGLMPHSGHRTMSPKLVPAMLPSVIGGAGFGLHCDISGLEYMACTGPNPYPFYEIRHRLDQLGDPAIYLGQVISS